MAKKYKTIKNVVLSIDGKPMVERISPNACDVLVRSYHPGECTGCHYHMKNCILPRNCIGQCKDKDHIIWIHYKYEDIPKENAIIKRAKVFDTLIDENGKKWIILEDSKRNLEVAPKFSEPI